MHRRQRTMRWALVGAILCAGLLATGCYGGAYTMGAAVDFSYPYPTYYRAYPYGYYGYPMYGYSYYGYPYYAPYPYWYAYSYPYYPYPRVGWWGFYASPRPIWGVRPHRGR
ncbi:MAG: hypothetical protein HY208_08935 [Nitrospirae bacterium]|nr:hypothetical protein [Nitrospirota bacterium]